MVSLLRYFCQCRRTLSCYITVAAAIKRVRSHKARTVHIRRICMRRRGIIPRIPFNRSTLRRLPQRNYSITRRVLGKVRNCPFLSVHDKHYVFIAVLSAYIRSRKRAERVDIADICLICTTCKFSIQRSHRLAVKYLAVSTVCVAFQQYISYIDRT